MSAGDTGIRRSFDTVDATLEGRFPPHPSRYTEAGGPGTTPRPSPRARRPMSDHDLGPYLRPTPCIESDAPAVRAFVDRVTAGAADERTRAVRLFYAVRDEIRYDPYG